MLGGQRFSDTVEQAVASAKHLPAAPTDPREDQMSRIVQYNTWLVS